MSYYIEMITSEMLQYLVQLELKYKILWNYLVIIRRALLPLT